MTGLLNLTGRLLKGALIGGVAGLLIGFVLLSVVGVVFGYGLLLGLYYIYLLIYYVAPIGMLVGAAAAAFRIIRRGDVRLNVASGIWIGVLLLGFVVLAVIPHVLIGEQRTVTHGATWWIDEERSDCETSVVTLLLYEYAHYEEICSAAVLAYLESIPSDVVPITYSVTYDFGEARGYHLSSIGAMVLTPFYERINGGRRCGRTPFPECDSPQARNDRMLYENSWVGE